MSLPPQGGSAEPAPPSVGSSGPPPGQALPTPPPRGESRRGGRRGGRGESVRRSGRRRRRKLAAIAAVGLTILVTGVIAVVALIIVSDEGDGTADDALPPTGEPVGEHGSLPECETVEGSVLSGLVPNPERTLDDSTSEDGWELHDCQWSSSSLSYGQTAGFAAVLFIRNSDDPVAGVSGTDIALEDLRADMDDYSATPIDGLGTEAASWYNTEDEVGCVGAVTANMYTVTCHDAQNDEGAWGGPNQEVAIDGARELAENVVPRVEVGDY